MERELKNHHIYCNKPGCDYESENPVEIKDLKPWIGKPCPKCGTNLLTEDEYKNSIAIDTLHQMNDAINRGDIREYLTLSVSATPETRERMDKALKELRAAIPKEDLETDNWDVKVRYRMKAEGDKIIIDNYKNLTNEERQGGTSTEGEDPTGGTANIQGEEGEED